MLIYGLEQALMVTHGYDLEFNQKKETPHLVQTTDGPTKTEKSHLEYLMDKLVNYSRLKSGACKSELHRY